MIKPYSSQLLLRLEKVILSKPEKLHLTCDLSFKVVQGGSNMTGTYLYVNKPHCAAAVRP